MDYTPGKGTFECQFFFQEDVGKAAPMRCSLLLTLVREARSSDLEGWVPWVRRGLRCPDCPRAPSSTPPRQLDETGSGLA